MKGLAVIEKGIPRCSKNVPLVVTSGTFTLNSVVQFSFSHLFLFQLSQLLFCSSNLKVRCVSQEEARV